MNDFDNAEQEAIRRYDCIEEIDAFREGALWAINKFVKNNKEMGTDA